MSFSILGTGKAVPQFVLTNDDLSKMVDTNDEWIRTRTGIRERRICKEETITDLCVSAAEEAMKDANITANELDLIICATFRGEFITPSEASLIQKRIGASCPAFDINGACSGFIFALDVALGYFARKTVKKVLVIGADNLSNVTDWNDRSTCVLFGDGSGAVVLGEGEGLKSIHLTLKGDSDVLYVPRGKNTSPMYEHESENPVVHMQGSEVYKFAVIAMIKGIRKALKDAGLTEEDVAWVVPHQANIRIINAAIEKLNIHPEKFFCNLDKYGNTSAGSVPIALDEANKAGKFKSGDIIVLCAFGAGLTTGSAVIRWE
ncbi:MAG: beta-ketoacyl-ACP synthase III [Bacillota bacterium]|nr:beta-ketoacyl-ACP synthase III [Bacillota bacterium]